MERFNLLTSETRELPKNFTGIVECGDLEMYYKNGSLHRKGGPAYIYIPKWKDYFIHGWYKNGKKHRMDGPAIENSDGGKEWWVNNKLHRVDGPAVEYYYGDKVWYLNGKRFFKIVDIPIMLIKSVFLGKEKGKYGLEWLRFMTETKVEEFPMIPGIREHVIERDPDLAHYFDEYEWI